MQVDGVLHHRVVDQHDAHALAVLQRQRFRAGERDAVERPGELLHVPGQVQLHGAPGFASVRIVEQAAHGAIGQYLATVVAQADAGIVEFRFAGRRLHVHQRIAGFAGGMVRCVRRRAVRAVVHGAHVRAAAAFAHHRTAASLHALVCAVATHVVAHVGHRQQRTRIARRDRRFQSVADGQRAARMAGAAHVLREDREGLLARGFDEHVEGLGHGDAELVHADRVDVLPVGGHDGHLQARDAHVEVGHRTAVDEAQQHLLAGLEQARPVAVRRGAIHQIGVGVGIDVGDVGGCHSHASPHAAVLEGLLQSVAARVAHEIHQRALVVVVVLRHLLHAPVQCGRIQVGPVRQQHHVLAVVVVRRRIARVHDQGAVQAGLLLEQRVAVVPVGTRLLQLEAVLEGFARSDAVEAQARHAIHVRRQQDAVPMDGGHVAQAVADAHGDRIAFAPAQGGRGQTVVDGDCGPAAAGDVDRHRADAQGERGAGHLCGATAARRRAGGCGQARQPQAERGAAAGQSGDELAAGGTERAQASRGGFIVFHSNASCRSGRTVARAASAVRRVMEPVRRCAPGLRHQAARMGGRCRCERRTEAWAAGR